MCPVEMEMCLLIWMVSLRLITNSPIVTDGVAWAIQYERYGVEKLGWLRAHFLSHLASGRMRL